MDVVLHERDDASMSELGITVIASFRLAGHTRDEACQTAAETSRITSTTPLAGYLRIEVDFTTCAQDEVIVGQRCSHDFATKDAAISNLI